MPDAETDLPAPRAFTFLTMNVGTTENISHSGDPDGYSDTLGGVESRFYGNNLAWAPARQALRAMFDRVQPDIVNFQELYWEGHCAPDCAGITTTDPDLFAAACQAPAFACAGWVEGNEITVRQVLGPDYAVACAPNHPDNCVGVRKGFGTLASCADGPCIDGLDGMPPPNGCTGGARVATAVVRIDYGPEVAVIDVHTVSGTNVDCRLAQFGQVFVDRGDGKPAAFGAHNIVAGDMNIDPFLMEDDASVDYWNAHVGADKPFHYISSSDASGPNTHPYSFMKLDHVISNDLEGTCVVLGVSEGTTAPLAEGSTVFDHRPVLCTVRQPTDATADLTDFKVMQFNLRTAFGDTDANAWANRVDLVARTIRLQDPLVFGTQEGWKFQLDDLTARLPDYAWVGLSRNGDDFDEYSAIFYRKDLLEVIDTATLTLSDTPDVFGSKFSDSQAFSRILTWAHLRHIASGKDLFAFNTHWDYVNQDDILLKMAALTARTVAAVAGDAPAFLTGDFNAAAGGPAWRVMTGADAYGDVRGDLVDTWTETGTAETGTFQGFTGVAGTDRIDWILHDPAWLKGLNAGTVTTHEGDRWPSDHFPVAATLRLGAVK